MSCNWLTKWGTASSTTKLERQQNPSAGSELQLRTLAPRYIEGQHSSYVRHLEAAVTEPRNKNIALTGRYGSGKSSILDEFLSGQVKERNRTLRISINTLGPDDDEALTNRIQKELVKQLVYRAKPGEIRHSRFARRMDPTWWRTLRDAVAVGGMIFGLLWIFGVRPDPEVFGADRAALSGVAFLFLVVGAVWAVRLMIGNRLVSQFSTGGTSISFDKQPESYFDEYLDEIVAFFDATKPDIVVFEDLDRFDDPQIFDSLRELNTLINVSAHWRDREKPLRFIYAIKDSLFDKLGEEPQDRDRNQTTLSTPEVAVNDEPTDAIRKVAQKHRDSAEAAVERANRTKFFEVVVPVVPFLSHSNARDLLSAEMEVVMRSQGTEISRGLLDVVARHATDMRLLLNIRNEFVVFAEKLLWIDEEDCAPGLTADNLFALVVYKNFHLADFEKLPHRGSALDELERKRRQRVDVLIERLRNGRHDLLRGHLLQSAQDEVAQVLGDRLSLLTKTMGQAIQHLTVGGQSFAAETVHTSAFWKAVSEAGEFGLELRSTPSNQLSKPQIESGQISDLFSEATDPLRWGQRESDLDTKRDDFDRKIAVLRGADFDTLTDYSFNNDIEPSFIDWVNKLLPSQLARDLVLNGHLNRYYAEYSAVFYGDFIGVDVANFFRNCVWPNEMNVHLSFQTKYAVQNILEQAPKDFTRSRSALNIQVVDHLLRNEPQEAAEVVRFLVEEPSDDSRTFLDAYLNDSNSLKQNLVQLLTAHPWKGLFDHLASEGAIHDDENLSALVDAGLLSASDASEYELGNEARALIADQYRNLTAFTADLGEESADVVMEFIRRIGLIVPSLQSLSASLRRRVVVGGTYELTAQNLRAGLGLSSEEAVTLDRISENEVVWRRCHQDIDGYLDAVNDDEPTDHTVLSSDVLSAMIQEQYETWTEEQLSAVLESSAPAAALPDITNVPTDSWPAIAATRLMTPSAMNLHEYVKKIGVDANLAKVLLIEREVPVEIEGLEDVESEVILDLRIRILNAHQVLESRARIWLALQLDPESRLDPISLTALQPSEDDLLAGLLEAGLVPDSAETFEHFLTGGWGSVAKAFAISEDAKEFLTPELIGGHVLTLLRDPAVPVAVKERVIADLGAYVSDGDGEVLREAASFAQRARIRLQLPQVEQVAPHASNPEVVLWQLASMGDGLDTGDAVRVLRLLGGDYEGFKGDPGHEFDVTATDSVKAILEHLKAEGRVELPRGGKRDRKKVKLI